MNKRIPDVLVGVLLACAIFAMGMAISSSFFPPQQRENTSSRTEPDKESDKLAIDDRIARYTLWLAILTGALVFVSGVQGYFLLRADKTARTSANTARRTLIANNRPWLVVTRIESRDDLRLGGGSPSLSFEIFYRNAGNSPASHVNIPAMVHLTIDGDAHVRHGQLRREEAESRTQRLNLPVSIGDLIFPGEERSTGILTVGRSRNDWITAANRPGGLIVLIIGEVSYVYANEGSQHETGFIFQVRRFRNSQISMNDLIIPRAMLEIERFPAGWYTS